MRLKHIAGLSLLATSMLCAPAAALTMVEAEFVCPLDGEAFTQRVAASGTAFGRGLDLKPHGPIAVPWTLPVCPTSGFVMFRSKFSAEELERLKRYVGSDEYRTMRQSETTYYLAAKLRSVLGETDDAIAFTLLQATWQTRNQEQYERYARETLAAHRRLLEAPSRDEKKWPTYELLSGELERRLGLFQQARERFERLKPLEAFATGVSAVIVEYQLKLVSEKDRKPYPVPRKTPPATEPAAP